MSGLKSLPEKGSRLPAVIPVSRSPSAAGNKRTGILGALAVFTPLAVEMVYGLTRKWLSETTASKGVSEIPDRGKAVKKMDCQSPGTAGYHRRCRGRQN